MTNWNTLSRKTPRSFKQLYLDWILSEGLGPSYNMYRIRLAWGECSGYANWTHNIFFRSGILYLSLNCSSVIKTQIRLQSSNLVQAINQWLLEDEMFIKDKAFTKYIEKIIIK